MWLFDHKLEAKPCEWYNHEPEMRKLSSKFPDVLFTLKGAGEESWDIWKKHFKGGKMQICQAKITFEHFDEAKLE